MEISSSCRDRAG